MIAERFDPAVGEFSGFAFDENTDFVFRTGVADDDPSVFTEFLLRLCDQFREAGNFGDGTFFPYFHAFEMLGIFFHERRHFRERHVLFLHEFQHMKCGDDAVSRGGVIQKYEVTGLFPAELDVFLFHPLNDVTVADGGDFHVDSCLFHCGDEPHVAHAGDGDGVGREFSFRFVVKCAEPDDTVAVYDIAVCIGEDNAVGIPIQRDAHVRMVFADKTAHLFGVRGSAVFVDIGSVRRGAI